MTAVPASGRTDIRVHVTEEVSPTAQIAFGAGIWNCCQEPLRAEPESLLASTRVDRGCVVTGEQGLAEVSADKHAVPAIAGASVKVGAR